MQLETKKLKTNSGVEEIDINSINKLYLLENKGNKGKEEKSRL